MNEAERQLTRDVTAWYARRWELGPPPVDEADVRLLEAELDDEFEYDTFVSSRARWLRAALYAPIHGLLVALPVFAWAGWYDPANILFFAFMAALLWFFPVLAATLPDPSVTVFYGPGMRRQLVHRFALAYLNAGPVRECLHAFVDALLMPLAVSWQEGLAAWFADRYLAELGVTDEPDTPSLRARNGRRLVRVMAALGTERLPRLLLLRG